MSTLLAPLVLLLSLSPAQAGTTLLHGPGIDGAAAGERAREYLGTMEFNLAGSLVDEVGAPEGGMAVVGTPGRRCPAESADGRGLEAMLVPLRLQLLEMDYAGAARVLEDLAARLPCRAAGSSRHEIWEVFFLKGLAAWNQGSREDARSAFAQAAALDPAEIWPTSYPPTAKETYMDAMQAAVTTRSVQLRTDVDGVTVDGRALTPGTAQTVYVGGHLLRRGADALWITVGPGPETRPEILVTSAERLTEGLLSGDPTFRPWLVDHAAARGWGDVLMVDTHRAAALRAGAFQPVTKVVAAPRQRVPSALAKPTVTGLVLLGAGAGVGALGLGLHVGSWAAAAPPLDGPLMQRHEYEAYVSQNRAGLALAVSGAAVGGTGIVLAIVGSRTARVAEVPPVLPWLAISPDGVGTGFVLRWE
jgi:hypothetical protein